MTKEVHLPEIVERSARGFDATRVLIEAVPDVTVETDDLAVYEVLGVFLENAFKHSPPESVIRITSKLEEGIAEIAVCNEGSLPENLAASELFQPFQRGADTQTRGVGLGLYIAARLADAIHGRVEATSDDGQVSFILRFPSDESVVARLETTSS